MKTNSKNDTETKHDDETIVKKLDFSLERENGAKETVRLSEDIIKSDKVFLTNFFKSEYLKYDKSLKTYTVDVDLDVLLFFSQSMKLNRINGVFNIATITDCYILQLMIYENDLKGSNSHRGKITTESKNMEQKLISKDEEIQILRERLKNHELQNGNGKQLDSIEKEIHDLRVKLREKTDEIIKLDNHHNDLQHKNKEKIKEISDLQQLIVDENYKMKGIILDLISAYKNENENDLKAILTYLVDNQIEFEEKMSDKNKEEDQQILSNTINKTDENVNELVSPDSKLSDKMIGEFDKMIKVEYKKLERYFNNDVKIKPILYSASQDRLKNYSGGKNYIEWKNKTSNDNFFETLRINKDREDCVKKIDVEEITQEYKQLIKSNLKFYDIPLNKKSYDEEAFVRNSIDRNNVNVVESLGGKSLSPMRCGSAKKIFKKEDVKREKFENNIRKVLFKYKQK